MVEDGLHPIPETFPEAQTSLLLLLAGYVVVPYRIF